MAALSKFDAYILAKNERDALLEEAEAMADRADHVVEILGRDPLHWTFTRIDSVPSNEPPSRRLKEYHLEDEADPNRNFIDPVAWPTIDAMRDLQTRLQAATKKANDAHAQLSALEKENAPKLSAAPNPKSGSGRARS